MADKDTNTQTPPAAKLKTGTGVGRKVPTEHPANQWGEVPDPKLERYPEDSPARADEQTLPSGQGGKTPHDGISYQDQFPPNPEPDDMTKAWGEYLEKKERANYDGSEPPEPPAPMPGKAKRSERGAKATNP